MRVVWWNGKLIPESEAKLSIYDSAFMFGDTIFEMTRSFNRIQFKLQEHLERLHRSAMYVRMPFPYTIGELTQACLDVQTVNKFDDSDEHRLMINITRGKLAIYESVEGSASGPNVIISDFPLRWTTQGMGKLFDEGINMVIPSQRAIPALLLDPKVKNRSRLHYLMANIEVAQYKGENNWPLLLDPDGFIAEGTGCNFFIEKDSKIFTPEPRNILRGITRDFVMKLHGNAYEKNLEPYDVYEADGAFVTGTPFCVLPVVSLNGIKIGDGKPGREYRLIMDRFNKHTGVAIKKQIQHWDNGIQGGTTPYQFAWTDSASSISS